jgi:hypothetical protein
MRGVIAALVCFLFFMVSHAFVFHRWEIHRRARILVAISVGNTPLYLLAYWLLPEDSAYLPPVWSAPSDSVTFLNGLLIYFFIFLGYCQFFYMAESSVGVRTLIELERAPAQGLDISDLTKLYSYDWMLDRRLVRLVTGGFLSLESGVYRNTLKGRLIANTLRWCKEFLRLGPGG